MTGRAETPADVSQGFTEVIGRALIDKDFRTRLYEDREAALKGLPLAPADLEALEQVPQKELEQHAERFEQGSATALTISVAIKGHFN
jgi:hypothetical protein